MVLLYLRRTMLSPEEIPTLPPPAAAAKDNAEEPCLAMASMVRFLAYTFFFPEVEEISAAVVRFRVSQFADTPMESPNGAPAPIAGVPVKDPIFV